MHVQKLFSTNYRFCRINFESGSISKRKMCIIWLRHKAKLHNQKGWVRLFLAELQCERFHNFHSLRQNFTKLKINSTKILMILLEHQRKSRGTVLNTWSQEQEKNMAAFFYPWSWSDVQMVAKYKYISHYQHPARHNLLLLVRDHIKTEPWESPLIHIIVIATL